MKRISNLRALLLAILAFGLSSAALARQNSVYSSQSVQSTGSGVVGTGRSGATIHTDHAGDFCGTGRRTAGLMQAVQAYRQAQLNGTLTAARKFFDPPDLGDERTFNVNESDSDTDPDPWEARTFRLVDKTDAYYMWVDVDELANGHVTNLEITGIRSAVLEQTPAGSIDSNKGILTNNISIFGNAPDIDGDGILDMLLYDIGAGTGKTVGYVAGADIFPNAPDSVGNRADVLYLDSSEGTRNLNTLAWVIAHEHTHLLHLTSGWDFDYTFATEGYAEYGMVLNGYFVRGVDYLNDPEEYQIPLFDWRSDIRDYQRAGLFYSYIAQRFGPGAIGRMLQSAVKGLDGLENILAEENSSLADIIRDFHTANWLNDTSIDPRFGHTTPGRQLISTEVTRRYNGEAISLGDEGPGFFTIVPLEEINGGSVKYLIWDSVADYDLLIDPLGYQAWPDPFREPQRIAMQSRLTPRIIAEAPDGSLAVIDIVSSAEFQRFGGRYKSLTVILVHNDPGVLSSKYFYEAYWTPLSKVTATEDDATLPSSIALGQNYPNPFNPQTRIPFTLTQAGHVRLSVFDILGREIAVILDNFVPAGSHDATLSAGDWPSGTYLYRLDVGGQVLARRMQLLK